MLSCLHNFCNLYQLLSLSLSNFLFFPLPRFIYLFVRQSYIERGSDEETFYLQTAANSCKQLFISQEPGGSSESPKCTAGTWACRHLLLPFHTHQQGDLGKWNHWEATATWYARKQLEVPHRNSDPFYCPAWPWYFCKILLTYLYSILSLWFVWFIFMLRVGLAFFGGENIFLTLLPVMMVVTICLHLKFTIVPCLTY